MGRSRRTGGGLPTVRGPGRKSKKQKEPLLPRNLQRAKSREGEFACLRGCSLSSTVL